MSDFEVFDALGSLNGACFGKWSISYPDCSKCLAAKFCEEKVKHGGSIQDEVKTQEAIIEDEAMPEISPMEYLFELLNGRFEADTKENEKAVAHYFKKDGKNVFTVIISKSDGKIKLHSEKTSKVIDALTSIEEAEEIVKEMI